MFLCGSELCDGCLGKSVIVGWFPKKNRVRIDAIPVVGGASFFKVRHFAGGVGKRLAKFYKLGCLKDWPGPCST